MRIGIYANYAEYCRACRKKSQVIKEREKELQLLIKWAEKNCISIKTIPRDIVALRQKTELNFYREQLANYQKLLLL